jgi:ribosomal-protein-alanine N-acetyltransferase
MAVALRTPRLLLREWRDDDREPFGAMSTDPAVMHGYLEPLTSRTSSDAWISRMRVHNEEHAFAYWAVELPGVADFIGAVGLSRLRYAGFPFAPAVEIGWRLARGYWRQGYATEAARAVRDDGFGRLALDEIVAFTLPVNHRSQAVMERLGMARDPADDFEHPGVPEGHPRRRHLLYRIRR